MITMCGSGTYGVYYASIGDGIKKLLYGDDRRSPPPPNPHAIIIVSRDRYFLLIFFYNFFFTVDEKNRIPVISPQPSSPPLSSSDARSIERQKPEHKRPGAWN